MYWNYLFIFGDFIIFENQNFKEKKGFDIYLLDNNNLTGRGEEFFGGVVFIDPSNSTIKQMKMTKIIQKGEPFPKDWTFLESANIKNGKPIKKLIFRTFKKKRFGWRRNDIQYDWKC